MAHKRSIVSLVVCVDFDDFLRITLPRNKWHFTNTMVVTSTSDLATQAIARDNQCQCFVTDAFYEDGATFNKGLAIEKALDTLGRRGWFCIWDADIVMPESIQEDYDPRCLYTPYRRTLHNPQDFADSLDWETVTIVGPEPNEFPGYFQLFHSQAAGPEPWYATTWKHAGGYDSDFQDKFSEQLLKRPSFMVLHLGPTIDKQIEDLPARVGENWCGRTTPRLDTGEIPAAADRNKEEIREIIHGRRMANMSNERLGQYIPRRMSFFWSGRMSWLRWFTLDTFVRHNPDWEVYLYSSDTPPLPKHWEMNTDDDHLYQGPDYRDKVPQQICQRTYSPPRPMASAQICDWFQWHLLAAEGGFFADMDIVWTASLESVWESVKKSDAVFCLESEVMAIGFAAAKPGCKLFRDMAVSMVSEHNDNYQHYGTDYVYKFAGVKTPISPKGKPGKDALQRLRRHYKADLEISVVPDNTVYPLDWSQVDAIWKERREVSEESVGLHWFGGNQLSRYWSQLLTEDNWRNHNNTLTTYVQRAME